MAKMPWLKLYTEIRTDPKMQALNDLEFRTWINILCLSAESKVRGIICIEEGLAYPIEGLARTLFISTEELEVCLNKFQKLRMIDRDQDGIITVIHFDDRQYEKPSDRPEEVKKRVQRSRSKKSNANVTPKQREENAIEEDKEGDIDFYNNNNTRGENEQPVNESVESVPDLNAIANDMQETPNDLVKTALNPHENYPPDLGTRAVTWVEKKWGRYISPAEADDIIAWCIDFYSRGSPDPDAVVIEALNECDAAGPDTRNRKYLGGILMRWQQSGLLTAEHAKAKIAEHRSNCQKSNKRNRSSPGDKPPKRTSPDKYENFYL